MNGNCTGRVAIVTGAAGKAMGRSIALTLAREGAKVIVNYRKSEQQAREVVAHIKSHVGEAIAVKADVTRQEDCAGLVEEAKRAFGQVDILIIGPGAGWHMEKPDKLNAVDAVADAVAELAPIHNLLPLVLPGMYERKWGRVIGLSLTQTYDSPAYSYNAAKAARTHALLLAARDAKKNGVNINVIGPGPVAEIATLEEAIQLCDHGPAWQARKKLTPQDIAESVAFLCSEAGRFVSATNFTF
jgi:3-oxoacyl-[acyl-carrier protein] reductase